MGLIVTISIIIKWWSWEWSHLYLPPKLASTINSEWVCTCEAWSWAGDGWSPGYEGITQVTLCPLGTEELVGISSDPQWLAFQHSPTPRQGFTNIFYFGSVQFSRSVVSDSLWPNESQHARPPCPSPTPGVHPDSYPSSQCCHSAISSSVVPFFSCPNPSQHQSLFQSVNSSHEVAKVLEFQL